MPCSGICPAVIGECYLPSSIWTTPHDISHPFGRGPSLSNVLSGVLDSLVEVTPRPIDQTATKSSVVAKVHFSSPVAVSPGKVQTPDVRQNKRPIARRSVIKPESSNSKSQLDKATRLLVKHQTRLEYDCHLLHVISTSKPANNQSEHKVTMNARKIVRRV